MPVLADTSVVARRLQPDSPEYGLVKRALAMLRRRGEVIYVTPQVMIEFRAAATRPVEFNGMGYSAVEADAEAIKIKRIFPMLPDTEAIYRHWNRLVKDYEVTGRRVYDARLVAVMKTHDIASILTLNPKDFRSFDGIAVLDPRALMTP